MARKKRNNENFNLSFLDVMACGFGATVLIFLLTEHKQRDQTTDSLAVKEQDISNLQFFVDEGRNQIAKLLAELESVASQLAAQKIKSAKIQSESVRAAQKIVANKQTEKDVEQEIKDLKKTVQSQKKEYQSRSKIVPAKKQDKFVDDKGRQYLSGLKISGDRILILMDSSASMLDETIVNVIRRRNMSDEAKIVAPKWQRALKVLDWLETQLQPKAKFQIYTFSSVPRVALPATEGHWLTFDEGKQFRAATDSVKKVIPKGGTNLYKVFAIIRELEPAPDSIVLLIDSLPTMGAGVSRKKTISEAGRLRHFNVAVRILPARLPLNIILFPMEGDPKAASLYWQLAGRTDGSFISPAPDWP